MHASAGFSVRATAARLARAVLLVLLSAGWRTCAAGVVPLANNSHLELTSRAGSVTDQDQQSASGLSWVGGITTLATTGNGTSTAFARIEASTDMASDYIGGSSGGGCTGGGSSFSSEGSAILWLRFRVDVCQDFTIGTNVIAGTLAGTTQVVQLYEVDPTLPTYWEFDASPGNHFFTARLSPGNYALQAANNFSQTSQTGSLSGLTVDMSFEDCANPLITGQPADITGTQGSTAQFSVGTSAPGPSRATAAAGTTTFQWRRNLVNLTDGGRISGATTDHLEITSIAASDTGRYDVLVTRDGIIEPSSFAHLRLTGTTSVDPAPGAGGLAFEAPSPNPFGERVRLRFVLPRAAATRLEVIDLSGRRVATLLDTPLPAGAHVAVWNGTTAAGARVESGVYFVRLAAENQSQVRRVVMMPPAK